MNTGRIKLLLLILFFLIFIKNQYIYTKSVMFYSVNLRHCDGYVIELLSVNYNLAQ